MKTHKKNLTFVMIIVFAGIICILIINQLHSNRHVCADTCISFEDMKILLEEQNLLEIRIDHESLTRERLPYKLINNTDTYYQYHGHAYIYRKYRSCWRLVEFYNEPVIASFIFPLPPNSYVRHTFDLYRIFGTLPVGEYKLIKNNVYRFSPRNSVWLVDGFILE